MGACPKCQRFLRVSAGRLKAHGDRYGFCSGSFGRAAFRAVPGLRGEDTSHRHPHAAYYAALAADAAFQAELVRVYGEANAGDARYRHAHTDAALIAAKDRKLAADNAMRDDRDTIEHEDVDGFTIKAFTVEDHAPDLSYLGEYKDRGTKGFSLPAFDTITRRVVRTTADLEEVMQEEDRNPRAYRFIVSGSGDPEYLEQDAKRLEAYEQLNWCMIGVVVEAWKAGVKLGVGSLWGIESDSDRRFIESTVEELVVEAVEEAKAKVEEIRREA